jgi:hypothetical protein
MRGRLGGWHRLFIVVACVHFGVVTLYVLSPPEYLPRDGVPIPPLAPWERYLYHWLLPQALLYALGASVGWIIRGFTQARQHGRDV